MKRALFLALGLAFGLLGAGGANAQSGALPDAKPKVVTSLIPERAAIVPGGTLSVALNEIIRKNWHTYWINPGDSGAPTMITWHLPPGWSAGQIQWPYPKRLPVGPLMNFGYEGQVALLSDIRAPSDARAGDSAVLAADVMWLVCSDVCIPEETHLRLPIAIAAALPSPDAKTASFFAQARARLPHLSPWSAVYDAGEKRFALLVESSELAQARPREVAFYSYADGMVEAAAPQRMGTSDKGLVIESASGYKLASKDKRASVAALSGLLVLTGADGRVDALNIEAKPGPVPPSSVVLAGGSAEGSLFLALVLAALGGLLLNVMPCVFPVLSMKALALAANREGDAQARNSALAYGAGVIVSFLALASALILFRSGGVALGWGFQLQQPVLVTLLALVMFAAGLNLSGLYEVGATRAANLGSGFAGKAGLTGSFFTGVLAVVVASPCTAPFMGAAMGYALAANPGASLSIFTFLAIGFAAPFLVLGFFPRALGFLPRPGSWMITVRQVLAFPMYGAAVWLIWILSLQRGSEGVLVALASGLALAFALWVYGRSQRTSGLPRTAGLTTAALAVLAAALLVAQAGAGEKPAESADAGAAGTALAYQPFSAARLAALRDEGKPVFVNATAAWCITCLLNEKVALSGERLARAFADRQVVALKADWTNQDAEITALLANHGRSGVPLYLYFPPRAETPVVLPQILTEATVISAVENVR